MPTLAQGTEVFMLVMAGQPAEPSVMEIEDLTGFNPGGAPADQVDVTTLKTRGMKKSMRGLRTPGQASGTVLADSANLSHQKLYELYDSDDSTETLFVIGWPDGPVNEDGEQTALPTVNAAKTGFELPATRTWFEFAGYVADFPFDHAANATINTALSIQRSGKGRWINKTA